MIALTITIAVIAVVLLVPLAVLYVKARVAALLMIFLAESLLIQNLHPERRPDFIIKKTLVHIGAIPWVVRPLATWYIKKRGIGVATRCLLIIKEELDSDGAVPNKGKG